MITHECLECGADFSIEHNNGETSDMPLTFCPFCGTELINELDFNE
jgi:predicted nucleic acid-binding Zn ribbon protein